VHKEHIPDCGEIYLLLFFAAVKPELMLGENDIIKPPIKELILIPVIT
jgi:hypothetical protein